MTNIFEVLLTGLAGSLLGIFYEHARQQFTRPRLSVDYAKDDGHFVDFNYVRPDGHDISSVFVRVRIKNEGRRVAKYCRVFLTGLEEIRHSGATPVLHEALVLGWPGGDYETRDIPRGPDFYADIVFVSKHAPGWGFCVKEMHANYLDRLPKYKGVYRFHVLATADDSDPVQCKVDVTYDGQDWHTFRADPVP